MEEHDVQDKENVFPSRGKKKRLLVRALLVIFLIVVLLLTHYFAFRAWAVYMMDNWPYYATQQGRSKALNSSFASFDSAKYSYDVEAEGFEIKATLNIDYKIGSESVGHVITEYYRFDSSEHAEAFLAELGEAEGRNRYVLGKYILDRPVKALDDANTKGAIEHSYQVTLGEFLYYLLVEFEAPILPGE